MACNVVAPARGIGARCADRAGGARGFKFALADCHVGYRQKSFEAVRQ